MNRPVLTMALLTTILGSYSASPQHAIVRKLADPLGVIVEVVDADLKPIPGVEVHIVGGADEIYGRQYSSDAMRPMWTLEQGRPVVADSEARLSIPPADSPIWLAVRREDQLGFLVVRPHHRGVHHLVLRKTLIQRIRTVDRSGKPRPGTPVAIFSYVPTSCGNASGQVNAVWRGKTAGPDAEVEVIGIEEVIARHCLDFGEGIICALDLPIRQEKRFVDTIQPETTTLVVPPLGSLEVRILDPEGRSIEDRVEVSVTAENEPAWRMFDPPFRFAVSDGAARIPSVPLDRPLIVSAEHPLFERAETELPPTERKRIRTSIRFPSKHPSVAGRLLKPDGEPLAFARVFVQFGDSPNSFCPTYGVTGSDGSFEVRASPSSWTEVKIRCVPSQGPRWQADFRAADLQELSHLGDICLRPEVNRLTRGASDDPRMAAVEGMILAPDTVSPISLCASLVGEGGRYRARVDSDGSFRLAAPPAVYSLQIRPWSREINLDPPLVAMSIEGVEVGPDHRGAALQLGIIDARCSVRVVSLRIHNAGDCAVLLEWSDRSGWKKRTVLVGRSTDRRITSKPILDVKIWTDEREPVQLREVDGVCDVTLKPLSTELHRSNRQ
ncbi:MAG: hypothetical protein V2A76_07375 [Planctomycetota bacterium]